jgi:hypothetical protein
MECDPSQSSFARRILLGLTRTYKGYFSSIVKGISKMVFHHLKRMCLGLGSSVFIHCD